MERRDMLKIAGTAIAEVFIRLRRYNNDIL